MTAASSSSTAAGTRRITVATVARYGLAATGRTCFRRRARRCTCAGLRERSEGHDGVPESAARRRRATDSPEPRPGSAHDRDRQLLVLSVRSPGSPEVLAGGADVQA